MPLESGRYNNRLVLPQNCIISWEVSSFQKLRNANGCVLFSGKTPIAALESFKLVLQHAVHSWQSTCLVLTRPITHYVRSLPLYVFPGNPSDLFDPPSYLPQPQSLSSSFASATTLTRAGWKIIPRGLEKINSDKTSSLTTNFTFLH